jgi:hypothetical protein
LGQYERAGFPPAAAAGRPGSREFRVLITLLLPSPGVSCFNSGEGTAMNRWFYGFFFFFPRPLAEGNG